MLKPNVCILRVDGTNCDEELFYTFEKFGAKPEYVHINQLRSKNKNLKNFQILALPGGFAYGDDVASGKILAVELISYLKNQLQDYINKEGFIIGICNGFQALVRTGLLPFGNLGKMDATLAQNESGRFECRWVKMKIEKSKCIFLNNLDGKVIEIAVNHGEGRFFAEKKNINKVEENNLVIARYIDQTGKPTQKYPDNPNGALNAIAAISDPSGRILGMMPHPEKFVDVTQHPNWRRQKFQEAHGALIFKSIINYVKES